MQSSFWLILYLLSWIVFFVIYQKKRKVFDAGSFLLCLYIVVAFASWRLYASSPWDFRPIRFFPFLYLFLMMYLSSLPVLKYDFTKIDAIQEPNNKIFLITALFFIVPALINFPGSILSLREGLILLAFDNAGSELYKETISGMDSSGDGAISNLRAILVGAFYNLGVLLTFYYLTLPNKKKWFAVLLILSVLLGLLSGVSSGQRGRIINRLLVVMITYFAMKKFYSDKIKRYVRLSGIILLVLVSIPIVLITFSRFDNARHTISHSILYYSGQSNVYFNNYGLDDNGIRYGDRTIPLFKRMLGFKNVPENYVQRREKYPRLYINDEVFCTHVGDFTIDFGPIFAVIIFVLFTIFFINKCRVKNKKICFYQLVLLHFVMVLCSCGCLSLYPFADTSGNLQVIVYFVAFVVFSLYNSNSVSILNKKQ